MYVIVNYFKLFFRRVLTSWEIMPNKKKEVSSHRCLLTYFILREFKVLQSGEACCTVL